MSRPPQAVFRADADWRTGGGHLRRCLSLAEHLAEIGWQCGFATGADAAATVPALAASGFERLALAGQEPGAMAAHWPGGADWLVVDHYRRDRGFEAACRPWARRILVIDDLADRPHDADLLVDASPGRMASDYDGLLAGGCGLLLGPEYALLRREFAVERDGARARRAGTKAISRILLSVGAADARNLTLTALRGLAGMAGGFAVDVVIGAAWPNAAAIRRAAAALDPPARVHVDVTDMTGLMVAADLAVGCGGTTAWERCCLGLPTLIVAAADNQLAIAEALDRAGAARYAGRAGEIDPALLAAHVKALRADPNGWRAMADNALAVTDGAGAARLAALMDQAVRQPSSAPIRAITADMSLSAARMK